MFFDDAESAASELPVVGVDWYDAYAYAAWVGKSLPTLQQWQRAARGDDQRLYPWGDRFDASRCVCSESNAKGPVAAESLGKGASPYGILHLAGNVAEWTSTDYRGSELKCVAGGSWDDRCEIRGLVALNLAAAKLTLRNKEIGFRCVRALRDESR